MSNLLIVESPAKAKTIEKYLGSNFRVLASNGHLRDLPKNKMNIDIENDFEPLYKPIDGKEALIDKLRDAVRESEIVYLATDPDREGEAISWHLKELLILRDENTRRVTFNEITKTAVVEAVNNPREIDMDLVDAQQARRMLDRMVGYKLSPFLWKKVKRGISAGRVQSVATKLVVDREKEIRAFIPEEYWSLDVDLSLNGEKVKTYFYGDPKKRELKTGEETQEIIEVIAKNEFKVANVKKGTKKKSPAPPFITSSLQQEASRKINMQPKKTMMVAQGLYEGVDIPGIGMTGLITYMRTDSLRLSDDAMGYAKDYIVNNFGKEFYKSRVFKSKKASQDAHEAIRPTNPNLSPDSIKSSLTPDQYKLYKLIWARFIATQMSDAILDTVSADIENDKYIFRATGHIVKFVGYTAVYEESVDNEADSKTQGRPLPELAVGDVLKCEKIDPLQHFTKPLPRFTEAALIRVLEEEGIGRPSTYAPTITTIVDRMYVEREGKVLRPTNLGEAVTELMDDRFSNIVNTKFTAEMEDKLDEVENGKVHYKDVLRNFYTEFDTTLVTAEKEMEGIRVTIKPEVSDQVCDVCGKEMHVKSSRYGKFLGCSGYPDCKTIKPILKPTGVLCPLCDARVVNRETAKKHKYIACENSPDCTFMVWDKVTKLTCPKCDKPLFKHYELETKESSNVCYAEGCGYVEKIVRKKPVKKTDEEKAEAKKTAKKETTKSAAAKKSTATKSTTTKKATTKKATTKTTTKKATKTTKKKTEEE
ncbi:MAG: type I DNA topoisomerase [Clostridia bacterium]